MNYTCQLATDVCLSCRFWLSMIEKTKENGWSLIFPSFLIFFIGQPLAAGHLLLLHHWLPVLPPTIGLLAISHLALLIGQEKKNKRKEKGRKEKKRKERRRRKERNFSLSCASKIFFSLSFSLISLYSLFFLSLFDAWTPI